MAKRGHPDTLVPAKRLGREPLPKKIYGARLPEVVGRKLDTLPKKTDWIRKKLIEGAIADGLVKKDEVKEWLQES